MRKQDIHDVVEQVVQATRNALKAGFDGVEIHEAMATFLILSSMTVSTILPMSTVVLWTTDCDFRLRLLTPWLLR